MLTTSAWSARVAWEMVGTTQRRASGDPGRTRQMIRNLISNADRYGGDRIEIRVGSEEEPNQALEEVSS